MTRTLAVVVLLGCSPFDRAEIPQGFGSITEGAHSSAAGFSECEVTTLADGGPGSLRECLRASSRRIVFRVAGTIALASDLFVTSSFVTIAGETAPPPGITIDVSSFPLAFHGVNDVIVRHLSFFKSGDVLSALAFYGDVGPARRIVIDHVTMVGAPLFFYQHIEDVTVSRSLFLGVPLPLAFFGPEEDPGARRRITVHANVFVRNGRGQPQLLGETGPADMINNVVYGWGFGVTPERGIELGALGGAYPEVNLLGNSLLFVANGSATSADGLVYVCGTSQENEDAACPGADSQVFYAGNSTPGELVPPASRASEHAVPAELRPAVFEVSELGREVVPQAGSRFRTDNDQLRLDEVLAAIGQ
jgi:hypothetical protein